MDIPFRNWIGRNAGLPNGITIEYQAWNEEQQEWQERDRVKDAKEFQWFCSWGPKLGSFVVADSLEELISKVVSR